MTTTDPTRSPTSARADAVAATRTRLVEAAMELFAARRYDEVTITEIARAAGVSHQTLLNHFDSKEGLLLAAAGRFAEHAESQRDRARPGDVAHALRILLDDYEDYGDANARWAAVDSRVPAVAPFLDQARLGHQAWLERKLGDLLPSSPAERRRTLLALHAATDVYTWKLLRRDLGLSRRATTDVMLQLVRGALAAAGQAPARPT